MNTADAPRIWLIFIIILSPLFAAHPAGAGELENLWSTSSVPFDYSALPDGETKSKLLELSEKQQDLDKQWESDLTWQESRKNKRHYGQGIGQMGPMGIGIELWSNIVEDPSWRNAGAYALFGLFVLSMVLVAL